jgi:hypothetical protein
MAELSRDEFMAQTSWLDRFCSVQGALAGVPRRAARSAGKA